MFLAPRHLQNSIHQLITDAFNLFINLTAQPQKNHKKT